MRAWNVAVATALAACTLLGLAFASQSERQTLAQAGAAGLPRLTGPYFGQKPPGTVPEPFAPDAFRGVEVHESPAFSRDGTELFVNVMGNDEQLRYFRSINGAWARETPPFDVPQYLNGLFLSPSGRRLYMLVFEDGRENFYYLEHREGRWSKRRSLGSEVNSLATHWSFSIASSEYIYFASEGDLYVSRFDGQTQTRPVKLPAPVNTAAAEMTPFVGPDESYLLFARDERTGSAPSGRIAKDLFISFRLNGDAWSEAVELGPGIYVPGVDDICPMVSPDGKYLFFVSRRIDRAFRVFWVDAGVVEDVRHRGGGHAPVEDSMVGQCPVPRNEPTTARNEELYR